ncbi:radical SAM family heme chaperone HemW [Sphingobacterium sp. SGR-19]|uniref:radical SAM family heme chaperone HemW n=1 Tax=Sphingobacterium sp. SGR-19 TaxID=2710886 RepID=UPI0013EE3B00|nr:radical SAM family heme chaperone HemW [Sphingobacterium sp. SGR-19]NGM66610.1 radical SAM family heme chaperone HemW [Sphingobacterium sp. SGR-19]
MIYFHIPFCKQACHYCDFHFSTSLKYKEELLQALQKEVALRSHYLADKTIPSIYFGGGTPSLLTAGEIQRLIDTVAAHFEIANHAEITLEANPDDLDKTKVQALRRTSVNRFSIGIQSFYEEDLRWMNRAHNASEAESSIKRVQDAGFENITADLIYGYPLLTNAKWRSNMEKLLAVDIPHISSYAMTVEQKTALAHFIHNGKTPPMQEPQSAEQMNMLIETLTQNGFAHYEISNFAKNGQYAKHNTAYWQGKHYLGIGPSAHSFDGKSRSWNIANNARYIEGITTEKPVYETENLSREDQFNEYVMTSLRTMWGIDLEKITHDFSNEMTQQLHTQIAPFVEQQHVESVQGRFFKLTAKGKLIADFIASELFIIPQNRL